MSKFDVIIPTFNNEEVLQKTLTLLLSQKLPEAWQGHIIISDDGSVDKTRKVARGFTGKGGWSIELLENNHAGPAVARNRAIDQAKGDILVLLGADILLRPGALLEHLDFHEVNASSEAAALGFIGWDPRLNPSNLMEWMAHGGSQNNYDAILGKSQVDPSHFFYGSFVSLKREFIGRQRLAERFTGYGWEDIELGQRLKQRGLKLYFLEDARSFHRHRYSVDDIVNRQRAVGRNLHIYHELQPQVSLPKLSTWRLLKHRILFYSGFFNMLKLLISSLQHRISTPRLYQLFIDSAFWQGYIKGLN